MSKVAEAMKTYSIVLIDHTLKDTKELLEKKGYVVIREEPEVRHDDSVRELGVLVVESTEDPVTYGIHRSRANVNGERLYFW